MLELTAAVSVLKLSKLFVVIVVGNMEAEPLQNLTEQSAGVGSWLVTCAMPPQEVTYTWNKGGRSGEGRKLQFLLVSQDGTQYCEGCYKKSGKEPKATEQFNEAKKIQERSHMGCI